MEFSVIIPLGFHRHRALDCVRGWISTQNLPGDEFELVCVLPAGDPDGLRGPVEALLRPHDRLILLDVTHDMSLCAEGAAHARGAFLFFTESHVWPEADVLQASKEAFKNNADWAAFSCRTLRVAPNRLARMEADLYERDIDHAMNDHPWRKILDQCFVTRRDAYVETGGFDAALGHFAEWALAARYFDLGLKIGYAPHIVLHHLYSGDIAELRAFVESFVEGEIRFFSRGNEADCTISDETPPEWLTRGDWDRKLAAALLTCLRRFALARPLSVMMPGWWREVLNRWIVAARGITWSRLWANLQIPWRRALLGAAAIAGSRSHLMYCYENFIGAVIHAQRLKEIEAHLPALNEVPCRQGGVTADNIGQQRRISGFHLLESHRSVPMRWSRPAAVIELSVPPGSSGIAVQCAPVRRKLERLRPMFFINEVPVPAGRIAFSDHRAMISLEGAPAGVLRLAWVCRPFRAVRDTRRLGLPIVRISVAPA